MILAVNNPIEMKKMQLSNQQQYAEILRRSNVKVDPAAGRVKLIWPFRPRPLTLPTGPARSYQDVLKLWFGNSTVPFPSYQLWFRSTPATDRAIKQAFFHLWTQAAQGKLNDWDECPKKCLAKLILVDQLSRHMFRGCDRAFLLDNLGFELAERCVQHLAAGYPYTVDEALIMAWPWLHQESLQCQHRALAWAEALTERCEHSIHRCRFLLHRMAFQQHLRIIERFGRYPHRNAVLKRTPTAAERKHRKSAWEISHTGEQMSKAASIYHWARFHCAIAGQMIKEKEFKALSCIVIAAIGSELFPYGSNLTLAKHSTTNLESIDQQL